MRSDARDNDLQDYLDGRMTGSRRRAYEERVAADDDLARRIREHRAAGAALRTGSDQLSPDFYARLRTRFEASTQTRPGWFRLVSWETAGLAAAVVIAVVLFVPFVVERAPGRPARSPEPAHERIRYGEEADEDAGQDAAARKQEEATKAPSEGRVEPDAQARPPASEALEQARSRPAAPAASSPSASEPGRKSGLESQEQPTPEPGTPALAAPAVADEVAGERSANVRTRADEPRAALLKAGSSGDERLSARIVPPHVVEPGTWRRIDTREAWSELEQDAAVGTYDPSRQIVLVGDRDGGLDCAATVVLETADTHEIRLAPLAAGSPHDGHGCAFVLPRDGRTVLVLGPEQRP